MVRVSCSVARISARGCREERAVRYWNSYRRLDKKSKDLMMRMSLFFQGRDVVVQEVHLASPLLLYNSCWIGNAFHIFL